MAHQMARLIRHISPHNTYPIIVRARAYNDLHQHQGCIKISIKMGSHLMLFLIAPNPDPGWTGFDAGFNTGPKWSPFWASKDGTSDSAHQIALRSNVPSNTPDITSDPTHFAPRIPTPVRARAYNDLHQHQGCIKTSIKWDPI